MSLTGRRELLAACDRILLVSRIYAYERDPYARTLATEVVAAGGDEGPWAVLADTLCYPGGGGQPTAGG